MKLFFEGISPDEFSKTYKWMLKKYPGTSAAHTYFDRPFATIEEIKYEKSGSKWEEVSRKDKKVITGEFYANCVNAVPFFKNLGGREKVELGYTKAGYIPVYIASISPDGNSKTVRKFDNFLED